ncbi:MAG TPA: MarR family transcriptional regulator [Longimicrobium sp.]|nr:MarR family transcriptional regulator [Longimicrobium sp.]
MDTERTASPGANPGDEARFIEQFARLLEQEGGPRIAGRIAALLLLSAEALPLDEIAERLQASKASISTNARMLEQWRLIERVSHPGDRRDYYRARSDGAVNLLERRLDWMRRLRDVADAGAASEAAQHPEVRKRFETLCRLHGFALRNVERTLRQLRRGADAGQP